MSALPPEADIRVTHPPCLLRAINGLVHRKQFYSTTLSMSGEWLVEPINDVHFVEEPDAEAMPFTQPVRVRAGAAAL